MQAPAAFLRDLQELHDEFQRHENGNSRATMLELYRRSLELRLELELRSEPAVSAADRGLRRLFEIEQPPVRALDDRIGEQMRRAERRAQKHKR